MSEYHVIGAVDATLRSLLWSYMQNDSDITAILADEQRISFEPPFKLVKNTDPDHNYLSLYLYRVAENAETKNRALEPLDSHRLKFPPLCLNLFYLITPITNTAENDHKLLGKAMKVLYENGSVADPNLRGILAGSTEDMRIILDSLSFEDSTKIWSAFMRSFRLAVSYEVKVVYIDSDRETGAERIRRKRIEYEQVGVS